MSDVELLTQMSYVHVPVSLPVYQVAISCNPTGLASQRKLAPYCHMLVIVGVIHVCTGVLFIALTHTHTHTHLNTLQYSCEPVYIILQALPTYICM